MMTLGAEHKPGMMREGTWCLKRHFQSGWRQVENEPVLESAWHEFGHKVLLDSWLWAHDPFFQTSVF